MASCRPDMAARREVVGAKCEGCELQMYLYVVELQIRQEYVIIIYKYRNNSNRLWINSLPVLFYIGVLI